MTVMVLRLGASHGDNDDGDDNEEDDGDSVVMIVEMRTRKTVMANVLSTAESSRNSSVHFA